MARHRIPAAKVVRLQARIRFIRGARVCGTIFFLGALGFVALAAGVPYEEEVRQLETQLQQSAERVESIEAEQFQRKTELKALREDPTYLEIHARDRLDYCLDGERVLRFRRDE